MGQGCSEAELGWGPRLLPRAMQPAGLKATIPWGRSPWGDGDISEARAANLLV